jgi:HEAT repeat protein
VVFAAASALYTLGDPRAYEIYYAVLTGERKSGQSLVESQMKMLKDPKAMAQIGVEAGLGFIPFAGIGLSVFKTATKDDTSPVRAAAAQKLIRDSDPKSAAALMESASDKKWLVRAAVVDAIAKRGDPALLEAVWPLLSDENETVRFSAAGAILRLTKQ